MYPTSPEREILYKNLNAARHIYNKFLEVLRDNKYNKKELSKFLTNYKKTEEGKYLNNHYSKMIQPIIDKIFSSIKGLSQSKKNGRKIGILRFKSRNRFTSFTYNQSGYKIIPTDKRYNKLQLSKIGAIRFKQSREIIGDIKQVQVKLKPSGWYCYIVTDGLYECKNLFNNEIGVDMGVKQLLVTSNKEVFANPLFMNQSLTKLKSLSKKLSRSKKGSNNRKKIIHQLLRVWEKINNQKNDYFHKITTKLVRENKLLVFEDLDIDNMTNKKSNNNKYRNMRNILDSSWATFMGMLRIKVLSTESELILVNPKNTSRKCSNCGHIKKSLQLWERTYNCEKCNLSIDRDYNASVNIYRLGKELTFVRGDTLVTSMKQESTPFRA